MYRNYDNGQLTTPISARLTQNREVTPKRVPNPAEWSTRRLAVLIKRDNSFQLTSSWLFHKESFFSEQFTLVLIIKWRKDFSDFLGALEYLMEESKLLMHWNRNSACLLGKFKEHRSTQGHIFFNQVHLQHGKNPQTTKIFCYWKKALKHDEKSRSKEWNGNWF